MPKNEESVMDTEDKIREIVEQMDAKWNKDIHDGSDDFISVRSFSSLRELNESVSNTIVYEIKRCENQWVVAFDERDNVKKPINTTLYTSWDRDLESLSKEISGCVVHEISVCRDLDMDPILCALGEDDIEYIAVYEAPVVMIPKAVVEFIGQYAYRSGMYAHDAGEMPLLKDFFQFDELKRLGFITDSMEREINNER